MIYPVMGLPHMLFRLLKVLLCFPLTIAVSCSSRILPLYCFD